MPPILMVPFRDINGQFSAFQYQQLALQRGSQVCMDLTRMRPAKVKVSVQGATKKRAQGRSNCYRVQCSIKLQGGYRTLWPSLQVVPVVDEWIPFKGMQQLTPRRTAIVDIHSKCSTKGLGYPSRVCPGYYEIRTLRLDVWVQVTNPSGWRRQTTATQVGYAWCMAHLSWAFGRDKPWLLGKKLQRMVMKPLPANAGQPADAVEAAVAAAAAAQAPAAPQPAAQAAVGAAAAEAPAADPVEPPAAGDAAAAGAADAAGVDAMDVDGEVDEGGLGDDDSDGDYTDNEDLM